MTKKVFDILPPESSKPLPQKEPVFAEEKPRLPKAPKGKKRKIVWVLIPLFLIIIVVLGFKISRAEIKIWPETETVTLIVELTVDAGVEESDFSNNIITGKVMEAEGSVSETFLSSGQTLKKAEGVIRLYNTYTTKSENWLTGTRFVSADGKLFKSKDKIVVPGAEIKDGKMVPSYIDVPVEAAEEGEDYNIGPSHFSIFVFRGTPRYTKFYGESSESMTGGGTSSQVTQQDLGVAEETLKGRAKIAAKNNLEGKTADNFVFLPDILETEISEQFSLARAGDEKEQFNFAVKAISTTIVFRKEDAENFVKGVILSQIPEQKLLYAPSLTIDYTPEIVDLESGRVVISLDFSAKIYPEINLDILRKGLAGKSLEETKIFLENRPSIMSAEIQFWPFWVKSVPNDLNKIEIQYPLILN